MMRFTYTPNLPDTFHAVVYSMWGTPRAALKSSVSALVFGAIVYLALAERLPWYSTVFVALLGAGLWGAMFTAGFGVWMASMITKRQRTIGPSEILVTDDGLERRAAKGSVKVAWSGISRIEESARVFFMFGGAGPVFAIEKSAVPSGDDLRALRRFLQERKPGRYRKEHS